MKSRSVLLAGMVLASVAAVAGGFDQQVQITKATDNRTLTVRYAGARAALIELRINGVSTATRAVSDDRSTGETNFTLDSSKLNEGENQVEIRLYDEAGKIVGTEKTTVVMDRKASGPVFLTKPQAGATLQGMVEISVGFKSEMKGSYVSFFVNDEFKALKNYAPYTYLWDTNTVTNGWHEVEAWVVDEGSNTFRTERMRVYVNNPGGQTGRETLPKAGSTGVEPRETLKPVVAKPVVAKPVVAKPNVAKPAAALALSTTDNSFKPVLSKVSGTKPASAGNGVMTNLRLMRPTGQRVAANAPQKTTTVVPKVSKPAVKPVEQVVTKPEVVVLHTAVKPAVKTKPMSKPVTKPVTPKVAVVKTTPTAVTVGTKLPNIGYYPIHINGSPVKFDVMPRVEAGIALTPFRHLFEHAGGKVGWQKDIKQVEAKGLGQDILFQIGLDYATVNGDRVGLERSSFLEQGRAIVPLSFVQQLLNVNVQYDPSTKHVLITKTK